MVRSPLRLDVVMAFSRNHPYAVSCRYDSMIHRVILTDEYLELIPDKHL